MSRLAFLSVTVVSLLALAFLTTFALAPQAAGAEPPRERMPRGDGRPAEPLPHLAAGAAPLATAPPPAPSSWASSSKLVFQSYRDGNWEIYRADGDGSHQTRLTNNAVSDLQPRLNRGSTHVAFATDRDGNAEIYAMNADGAGQTRLTYAAEPDVNPAWSKDSTRLAFESYRTGEGDIYVMNADGSNQTRLTDNATWDGDPVWSPDGRALAFTSYRDTLNRIWRMNSDGSGQVQLSSQPYSEHAAWSPDGSLIAFDADANGDGWQELWLMNADGTNQRQVYDPSELQTDALVGSWSPDGRFVAFTRISWVKYGGQWYWTTSYLDAWELSSGSIVRLSANGEDMEPDWQTADLWSPNSRVTPLPALSPAPIPVSWSGIDEGPAGIAVYDVQVRELPGGAWTDWLLGTNQTSASYAGLGGRTYAFRSRARDFAGNVETWPAAADASTTVEALPPRTEVSPLPPYVRGQVEVAWGGSDDGGSGIAYYDVQMRDGPGGDWFDFRMGTADVSATLSSGQEGHTYFFRCRGVDRAQNVEAWPAGDGDAFVTLYGWAIRGILRDNRDTPLMGALVALHPDALAVLPSDADGAYSAYEATASQVYSATWSKAGYNSLPTTEFSGPQDARADEVLPPAGDVVTNGGFETGSLAPAWQASGEMPPTITATLAHTGRFSASLGPDAPVFGPWVNLSNSPGYSRSPVMVVDGSGALHVIWIDSEHVLYTWRRPGGSWAAPVDVCGSYASPWQDTPRLAVQADGAVHVAFQGAEPGGIYEIFYNHRSPDGTWSGPVKISKDYWNSWTPDMALGPDGAVHLVWADHTAGVMYAQRSPGGAWSAVIKLSPALPSSVQLAVGTGGTLHVVWPGDNVVQYAWRGSGGAWSAPLNLPTLLGGAHDPVLAAAADGSVHVASQEVWLGSVAIVYTRRSPQGTWSAPLQVSDPSSYGLNPRLALGPDGSVHLAWTGAGVVYAHRGADGAWSRPDVIGSGQYPELDVDSTGTLHIVRSTGQVSYARRTVDGAWSDWINVANTPLSDYKFPRLAVDSHGDVHVAWQEGGYETPDIAYAEFAPAAQTGDSILSRALTVPAAAVAPTLSFWYRLQGIRAPGATWLDVQVDDGHGSSAVFTATRWSDWTHAWVDLSPWAGQAISLRFRVHQTQGQLVAGAILDEVSVGPAYPDVWVSKPGAGAFSPLQPVVLTLRYGNRGGVGASGVTLVDVLPPELQFLAADPPPTTLTPQLTWQVAGLPPRSGPFTVILTATVAPGTPLLQSFTNTVTVQTALSELEILNNQASAPVWIGYRVWLPVIVASR